MHAWVNEWMHVWINWKIYWDRKYQEKSSFGRKDLECFLDMLNLGRPWDFLVKSQSMIAFCHCAALSHVRLFVTLWTVARQALYLLDFPGKNTGVGYHFLLQGIFPTQGSNQCLLNWQTDSLMMSHWRSPDNLLGGSKSSLLSPLS